MHFLSPAFLMATVVCVYNYVKSSLHASILNMPDINFRGSLWCSVIMMVLTLHSSGVIYTVFLAVHLIMIPYFETPCRVSK